ncbi:protease modulator HflC [Desulfocapsa sp. AH-315-G09]|jgi:membrane protease subunit HflC|uniref:Protein HflC n=1 Tax=Desulfotalea psychrophila TaxID=84980 RepID=A0ABS3AVL8_9BACT|nr:protease modulator HflC [Desulfocapsa sp. AH-315-J15]MBN4065207.1 protease modulator HflC [Desulfocapsa sp. AH-315-G09]MBN4068021.1 protease modulator HflC [Desulfotalea psychrophila]
MKQIAQFFLIGLVLLSITVVFDGFFILKEGQQAMITQFGAPVGEPKTEAGFKFKLPFVQDVNYFDKRVQIWDGDPNQIPTNDKTFVYLDVSARWRITDALQYMQAVKTEARAQSLLDDIIDGTVRDMVNKNDLIEIIRSSDWSLATMTNPRNNDAPPKVGRDGISNLVLEAAAKVTPQYGIELLDVMFKRVNYIESVRLKVYDRMISERKRIAAERRSTGEGKKAEILGKVERELTVILSEANREASEIKGQADASATKIYGDIYNQDPEFFSFYKTLQSYSSVIGKNTSLILSADSDLFQYLQKVDN